MATIQNSLESGDVPLRNASFGTKSEFRQLAIDCSGGPECPAVFEGKEKGELLIRGYQVASGMAGSINLGEGELIFPRFH